MSIKAFGLSVFLVMSLGVSLEPVFPLDKVRYQKQIAVAIDDPRRPSNHRSRDVKRHPDKVLALSNVGPGSRVADLGAFGGYYTALLSRLVGHDGIVYAMDYGLPIQKLPQFNLGRLTPTYLREDPRDNVVFTVQERFDTLEFPEALDAVFLIQHYHDTMWTGENRDQMNAAIFKALKPGGRFIVIDHSAKEGAGIEVVNTLHRVDPLTVKAEIMNAGFLHRGRYDFLANSADTKDLMIAMPEIRGNTDRFLFVFEKPE